MQKTANLLLLMMLFLFFSFSTNMNSSATNNYADSAQCVVKYEKWMEYKELERRAVVEKQLYDSLVAKSSIKWVLTGFSDAQIHIESKGDQNAVSSEGAIGVAQFLPSTWEALIRNKLIPEWFVIDNEAHQRIAQLVYLSHLYELWPHAADDRRALTAASYNAGPGRIKRLVKDYGSAWRDSLPSETVKYLHNLKKYV
jgi:soluble lytic murein transglycosylase-like protein